MFLLFLIFLIVFSIIGANIYSKISYEEYRNNFVDVNEFFNLDVFWPAFLLNFRNSGESWPYIMKEYAQANPDIVLPWAAYVYFILSNFILYVVLVNLFLLIVLQEFYAFQEKGENPVEKFDVLHENFTKTWNLFSEESCQGFKITIVNFYKFLFELDWEFSSKLMENGQLNIKSVNSYLFNLNIKK